MTEASKKVRTSLKSPNGKVVFKKKIGRKMQAVNNSGNLIKVDANKSSIQRAGLPVRVQAKDRMKQGYKARGNESVAMKNGKASSKKQSNKSRLNEREAMRRLYGLSPLRLK